VAKAGTVRRKAAETPNNKQSTAKHDLVIVESPAKAKTINKYLGKDFSVKASMGHVRDLPKKKLGVDVKKGIAVEYEVLPLKKKVLDELKVAAEGAESIYLAADPDREGEAICWHLAEELVPRMPKTKKKARRVHRVVFNEITKRAIEEAFQNPTEVDLKKVDAQQARRVLDRLVGYKVSPILWDKVRRGLSAGRVQSVALRLICDREREIRAFKPEEYWTVVAHVEGAQPPVFPANLLKRDGKSLEVTNGDEAAVVRADLEAAAFRVEKVQARERRRNPVPPFITSKLQQEGFRKLGFRGYAGKFFPIYEFRAGIAAGFIAMFVGLVELMLEFVKPITLSMRLFGNIYGGEVALSVITGLTLAILPVGLLGLDFLLNAIQALIFSILTLVFITLAIESHDHEEGHAAEDVIDTLEGRDPPALQPAH
jgi:reverse gyrase